MNLVGSNDHYQNIAGWKALAETRQEFIDWLVEKLDLNLAELNVEFDEHQAELFVEETRKAIDLGGGCGTCGAMCDSECVCIDLSDVDIGLLAQVERNFLDL